MAMFLYENKYKLPALYKIPDEKYIWNFITMDKDNKFVILTIATKQGYFYYDNGSSSYIYRTKGETADDLFNVQAFVAAYKEENIEEVRELFQNNDITNYKWTQFWYQEGTFYMPTYGNIIWADYNYKDSNGNLLIYGTLPQKIASKGIDIWNFLEGYLTGYLDNSMKIYPKFERKALMPPDRNETQYPYLLLINLKQVNQDEKQQYAMIVASDQPFKLYNGIIYTIDQINFLIAFTDFSKWITLEDSNYNENWYIESYSQQALSNVKDVIWSNYELIDEKTGFKIKYNEYPKFW